MVIYEGRQIYFGPASKAKEYFIRLGFKPHARQTTPDFLTSMTSPSERVTRPGFNPPQTPEDFAAAWKASRDYRELKMQMEEYQIRHPIGGSDALNFREQKKSVQAHGQRLNSAFMLSYSQQVMLCLWRGYRRLLADPGIPVGMSIGNLVIGLILSSLFYNLGLNTDSFYGRSCVLFMTIISNAFASMLEIFTLYDQRPIVEKQNRYAFYHPSAESYSSVLLDLPIKLLNNIVFNSVFYFMTNLNRQPGPFFFYMFVMFLVTLAMSGVFRSMYVSSHLI